MRPSFSEFSFGFGVSTEIQQTLKGLAVAAPIFPSLIEEARLGYDVKFPLLGASVFLQFKRSDALTRASAAEWKVFGGPYYRFPIYRLRESKQHNRLVMLGQREPFVYYCAPLFRTIEEFNRYYLAGDLLDNTEAIRTANLPLLRDNNQHSIVYDRTFRYRFLSIPEPVGRAETVMSLIRQVAGFIGEGSPSELSRIDLRYFLELLANLRSIPSELAEEPVEELEQHAFDQQSVSEVVLAIQRVARTLFGVEWFLVVRPPEKGMIRGD